MSELNVLLGLGEDLRDEVRRPETELLENPDQLRSIVEGRPDEEVRVLREPRPAVKCDGMSSDQQVVDVMRVQ
jgi:hypothetical protein